MGRRLGLTALAAVAVATTLSPPAAVAALMIVGRALRLRLVCGLTTAEVDRAFLVSERPVRTVAVCAGRAGIRSVTLG
ncbi:hypothetical protein Ari01nite_96760 [Paractinoplanes rishiriensis]|uniref:Secreted protein n=1 Tax=Paractinoplanes rishiriensis TaxID=1050105 RepID=A0A919K765_9ACTN|nr:hypothetical protein Ari01nite_96760 [Actinoplanes rishiriensis]